MKENNLELIEIDNILYSIDEIRAFINCSEELSKQNFILKQQCRTLTAENTSLKSEIKDMKFTRNYLTGEEAGKAFARELLGKPMTREDLAIEAAEDCYVPYNGDDF